MIKIQNTLKEGVEIIYKQILQVKVTLRQISGFVTFFKKKKASEVF